MTFAVFSVGSVEGAFKSSPELPKELEEYTGTQVSASHVRKALVNKGLKARKPRKKPFVNDKQWKARLLLAEQHQNWTLDGWSKSFLSDESNLSP